MSRIGDWLNETDTDADTNKDANHRPMCLLTGSAGLGKSTIAQTLAKDCADAHILAGSFFFSHSSNNTPQSSSSISKVVLTFAYQLAVSIPPAQDLIKDAFHADPSIPDKNLAVQFKKLIYQPLLAIAHLISPMVVIVDALDACEDRNGVVKLIEIITAAVLDPHKFPLRFFFTSRLEDHIREKFEEQPTGLKTCRLALEDFRRFDETEEDEIVRLSPRELVETYIPDNPSAQRRILHLIESSSTSGNAPSAGRPSNAVFSFPYTLSGRGGDGKNVTSFIEHPLEIDLQKPFTFLAWCYSSDTVDWRTMFSFESPLCHSSLLCVAAVPRSSQIYIGYMRDAQHRMDAMANAYILTSAWFHFAFVLLDSSRFELYINGVNQHAGRLNAPLYNPGRKQIILGQNIHNGNLTAQWNGKLRDVRVFDRAFTEAEITVESKWTD